MDGHRNGLSAAAGEHLVAARGGVARGVEKLCREPAWGSALSLRRRCWRRTDGSKDVGRIMLECSVLAWDSENYNIIDWGPWLGISIASFAPVEPISQALG